MSGKDGNLLNTTQPFSRSYKQQKPYPEFDPSPEVEKWDLPIRPQIYSHQSFVGDSDSETASDGLASIALEKSSSFSRTRQKSFDFVNVAEGKKLVIAIDYGTTYTGVAYAVVPVDEKIAKLNDIQIILDWNKMSNSDKVPSVYSYSKQSSGAEQWGFSLSDDAVAMVHTKMELDKQPSKLDELDVILSNLDGMHDLRFDHVVNSNGEPDFTYKKPEAVVLDYMKKVFARFMEGMGDIPEEILRSLPVDIVITHPVVWSYQAKNATYRAVTLAGFNKSTFPKLCDIMMLAEPEAAAIYTARYLKEEAPDRTILKKNMTFVLVDAGGGTVDVVTFRVVETEPTLVLHQIGAPHSTKCGSVLIDSRFKYWLRDDVLGPDNFEKLEPNTKKRIDFRRTSGKTMRNIMSTFIEHKCKFGSENQDNPFTIEIPKEFDGLTIDGWVRDGQLTLDGELMEWFFEDCVNEIVRLVKIQAQQVDECEIEGVAVVKTILMIGGFGESKHLQSAIRENLKERNITVHRPDTSWSAVVRGAALYGIEKALLKDSVTTAYTTASYAYFYGVAVDVEEPDGMIPNQYKDPITGKTMGRHRLSWVIRCGDLAYSKYTESTETLVPFNFTELGERTFQVPVYKYLSDDELLPRRVRDKDPELELILTVPINLAGVDLSEFSLFQSVGGRQPYYQCVVSLFLTWNDGSIGATAVWKQKVIYASDRM